MVIYIEHVNSILDIREIMNSFGDMKVVFDSRIFNSSADSG